MPRAEDRRALLVTPVTLWRCWEFSRNRVYVSRPGKLGRSVLRRYEFKARPFIERWLTRIF
jgi:hypothetical protein